MLFKRRVRPSLGARVATWLWPRRSWRRSARYVVHRILRLSTTPHAVALGAAAGVFASVTPLIGGQMLLAGALAFALRASVPAALLATFFGNPLSWPFIWGATYAAGAPIVVAAGIADPTELASRAELALAALAVASPEALTASAALARPLFVPMLAGSLPVGLLVAVAIYYIVRSMARLAVARGDAAAEGAAARRRSMEFADPDAQSP